MDRAIANIEDGNHIPKSYAGTRGARLLRGRGERSGTSNAWTVTCDTRRLPAADFVTGERDAPSG